MSPPKAPDEQDIGLVAWLTLLQTQSVVTEGLESDLDMPLGWFEVLLQLASAPDGRLKMQELAHSVLLSKSGVTRLVDRMAEEGLVERAACETDRRSVWAMVSPKGRAALRKALPAHAESLSRRFSTVLTAAELRLLRSTLQKVLDAGGFAAPPCPGVLPDEAAALPVKRRTRSRV
jgi:DNA-binding MarR family transcriptional regulator